MLAAFDHGARTRLRPWQKLPQINWPMVALICILASIGFVMLYSAAGGRFDPWADRQMVRFAVGLGMMLTVAVLDLRLWLRYSYLIYGGALTLLVAVEIAGEIGMGAQRWIDLGFFQLQPSELMKVALILALARYFHGLEA
ncbi:MAG TPA: FtsW/RodA/SpoVE family cell cycle protein, partial [Alphaproteobacteria bacterium]|nr:FtsW/RodA/SpoVE family cell cycle protein [Alphaproteobacteria bacterium]